MTEYKPQSIPVDPKTLNENLVQEVMAWTSSKSTGELKNTLTEAQNQLDSYSPETIEAMQRILANRGDLTYSSVTGQQNAPILDRHFQVKLSDGTVRAFNTHAELRTAILDGTITKDAVARCRDKLGETFGNKQPEEELQWQPIQTYAESHVTLAFLYCPMRCFMMMGCVLGVFLASQPFFDYSFVPSLRNDVLSVRVSFFSLIVVFLLGALIWGGSNKKSVFLRTASMYVLFLFHTGMQIFHDGMNTVSIGTLVLMLYEFVNQHCWIIGYLMSGIIFGGPLGAIVGTSAGYLYTRLFPQAPDATPEGTRPYRLGLLYPAIFLLIVWPIAYFWFFPWYFSMLPLPSSS